MEQGDVAQTNTACLCQNTEHNILKETRYFRLDRREDAQVFLCPALILIEGFVSCYILFLTA